MTGKPSSVVDDHLSRPGVAAQAPAIAGNTAGHRIIPIASCTRWGLHHGRVARPWVSSYLAFPPLLILADGRYISVALSLESPPPAVSWHPALWCSDFPHTFRHAIVWSPRTFPIIPFHTPKVKWAVPTPGSRLGCAPSVRVRARGASLRLARRHSSRRASRACGGHASQRARRDAEHGDAGRFAPRPTGWKCRLRMCRSSSMPHDISMKERLPVRPGEESPAARRPGPGAEADPQADTSAAWASRGRRWGSARSPRPGRAWRWDCASA